MTAATFTDTRGRTPVVRSRGHGANVLRRLLRNPVAMIAATISGRAVGFLLGEPD